MSNLHAASRPPVSGATQSRRRVWLVLVVAIASICLVIAFAYARTAFFSATQSSPPVRDVAAVTPVEQSKLPTVTKAATPPPAKKTAKQVVSTKPAPSRPDEKLLWASPTHGKPIELNYLPPGVQLIAVTRPADLLKHAEGEKVRGALGPEGDAMLKHIEQTTGVPLRYMDQLIIGGQVTSEGIWLVTFVVRTPKAISAEKLLAKLPDSTVKEQGGTKYWLAGDRAFYLPEAAAKKVLVVAPATEIDDIIDLAGNPPPLRRDIERLIDHTDAQRHVTIILAPNSLFSEGQSIFAGELSALRQPLFWFLGDELSGAALSMHWDENFFLELIATPTLDTPPEKASRIFAGRVAQVPDKLEKFVATLNVEAYDRLLVTRLPAMLRKLNAYTRTGADRDHAVLRCYLPLAAGHNLLMGTELALAESQAGGSQPARTSQTASVPEQPGTSVRDALAKIASLRFAKDTLEAALEQLSQAIGVPIVIRGPDLQADGITKNQSFGIDVSNKPAEEILVQVLRLANPDKEATGPADPRQKLVYIVEHKADKTEQIVITTRAKAAERHDELPAVFRKAKP